MVKFDFVFKLPFRINYVFSFSGTEINLVCVFIKFYMSTEIYGDLNFLRCPPGLAFDLDKQTCEWRNAVQNCNTKARPKLILPLFNTKEPLCDPGYLACGDGQCVR